MNTKTAPDFFVTGRCGYVIKWRVTTRASGNELPGPEKLLGDFPSERMAKQALADAGFTNFSDWRGWRDKTGYTGANIARTVEYDFS